MKSEEIRRRVTSVGAGLWVGLVVACAMAPSAVAADAGELIRQGVALRRAGDDAAALQLFEQAYQADQSPRALAQMGLAEQAMGRWVSAHEHLKQSLASPNDRWIKKSLVQINGALARVDDHVGHIDLRGGTPDAEVRIEGVRRGTLPMKEPLAVATGKVTIDVSLPGFNSLQRVTVVGARETVREFLDPLVASVASDRAPAHAAARTDPPALGHAAPNAAPIVAIGSLPPADAGPRPGRGEAPVVLTKADRTPEDSGPGRPGRFRPAAKWVAWGSGVVALAVGTFGAVRQNQAGEDFGRGCAIDPGQNVVPLPDSGRTTAACQSLKNKVDTNYIVEVGGFVGAGALAATGLILWLTEPMSGREETAHVACSPSVSHGRGPWLSCALRF